MCSKACFETKLPVLSVYEGVHYLAPCESWLNSVVDCGTQQIVLYLWFKL